MLDDLGQWLRLHRNQSATGNLRSATPDYWSVVSPYLPQPPAGAAGSWTVGAVTAPHALRNLPFGMPLRFRSASRSRKATKAFGRDVRQKDILAEVVWVTSRRQGEEEHEEEHDRRASPLFMRMLRLEDRYAAALLLLESEFVPEEATLRLQPGGRWPSQVPKPGPLPILNPLCSGDYGVVRDFL